MRREKALIYLLISSFLWGTSFPVVKLAVSRISPFDLFFLRFTLSTLILLPLFKRKFIKAEIILLGFLNSSAFILQFVGQKFTTATEAALITVVILPMVAFLSIFIDERADLKKILAVLLTIVGAVIITTKLNFAAIEFTSIRGNLLVFLAAFLWSGFTVISRKIQKEGIKDPTWGIILWTGFFSLPVIFFKRIEFSSFSIGISLYLAVFATILSFYLFLEAMRVVDATTSSIFSSLELVFAIILSMIFLGERLTTSVLIGGGLILASIILVAKEER